MRQFRAALAALLLLASLQTQAAVGVKSVQIVPSADGTLYSAFPDGDGPTDPGTTCDVPTGWACTTVGTGTGSIVKQSDTVWDFDVIGNSATQSNVFAYKDAGSGDVQLIARITDDYAGSPANFAGLGCGLREGTGADDWQILGFSPQSASYAVRVLYGSAGTYTGVNGSGGQTRPQCVAYTYDVSQTDLRVHESDDCSTYTQVAQVTRDMADVIAFAMGQGGSASASFRGTIDQIVLGSSITVYTPEDPPVSGDPVCAGIPNQSWTEGLAVSFAVSSYCEDPNGDALTYSASGFPGGTGLAISTSGLISGVPTSSDVGVRNIEITATDTLGNEGHATFQATVAGVATGDILTISSGTATVDCDTFESGGKVDPGDILQIAGGVRGPLVIRDCQGTASQPIVIRNDISDNEAAVIRRSSGNAGGFIFRLTNVDGVVIDGSGKYSGADSGVGGVDEDTLAVNTGNVYGLIVDRTSGANRPAAYLKFDGTSCIGGEGCVVRGVKVDGVNKTGSGGGICFDINDHAVAGSPGVWRENILFEHNYGLNCGKDGGEGIYAGPNLNQDDVQLRNVEIRYNAFKDVARDCINVKGVRSGTNRIHHNHMDGCGLSEEDAQNAGIALQFTASWKIDSNVLLNPNGNCISAFFQPHAQGENGTLLVENNIFRGCGSYSGSTLRHGVHVTRSGSSTLGVVVQYNTFATVAANGVNASGVSSCTAPNNIMADISGSVTSNCTSTNNRTGSVASQDFANAGADDYHLTTSSPARNSATGSCPNVDFEDEARPQQGACDQGADEYTP